MKEEFMRSRPGLFCAIFCSAVLCVAPLLCQEPERLLTIDEAITTGLNNSQDVLIYKEQIAIAQQRVSESRSIIFPKIDFNLNASQVNNDLPVILSPSFNSTYLPDTKKDIYYTTRLSLWQYLYASGRYTTNLKLAEINLSQAQSQADASKNKVVLDVKKVFYACLILKEKIRAYKDFIKEASGRSSVSSAELELAKLKYRYEKEKLEFLRTTGLELNTIVEISGELSAPDEEYDLNKCLAWAFQYRPELRQTQFQETIDSLRVNLSMKERYPTVALGANYEWIGEKLPLDRTSWNATINVNVPIFDGWASWSRIKQRRSQAREGKIRRAKIEDQIRSEVRDAHLDYVFWKEQTGKVNSRALPGDPEKKLETKLLKLDTLYKAIVSEARLDWAIGKLFFDKP
ncbi:MAG: TolC family protein [Endomicrobiales bacterium]|nr:TolC family protein [Endomicrobiales bacterium]